MKEEEEGEQHICTQNFFDSWCMGCGDAVLTGKLLYSSRGMGGYEGDRDINKNHQQLLENSRG